MPYPLFVQVGVADSNRLDIVEIFWPMSNGFHDDQIFRRWQAQLNNAHIQKFTSLYHFLLKWQNTQREIDVCTAGLVTQKEDMIFPGKSLNISNSRGDPMLCGLT